MSGKDDKGIIAFKNTKILTVTLSKLAKQDFPGCLVVKNPLANLGDMGLITDLGKSHMSRGNWAYAPKLLKPECSRACAGQQKRPLRLLPSPSLLCSLHGGPMTLRGEGLRQGADFNWGAGWWKRQQLVPQNNHLMGSGCQVLDIRDEGRWGSKVKRPRILQTSQRTPSLRQRMC